MWVSWWRDLSTCTNVTLVHCTFEKEESFIAVHVYCILVVVAHSTGTISVAQYIYTQSSAINLHNTQCKCIAADNGVVDENGIVGFVMLKSSHAHGQKGEEPSKSGGHHNCYNCN